MRSSGRLPSSTERSRYPSGFEQVIVNGQLALGAHAEVRGRLLVHQQRSP
jgi:hypothetical protein